jgi:hypothetical protein
MEEPVAVPDCPVVVVADGSGVLVFEAPVGGAVADALEGPVAADEALVERMTSWTSEDDGAFAGQDEVVAVPNGASTDEDVDTDRSDDESFSLDGTRLTADGALAVKDGARTAGTGARSVALTADGAVEGGDINSDRPPEVVPTARKARKTRCDWTESWCTPKTTPITRRLISVDRPHKELRFSLEGTPGDGLVLLLWGGKEVMKSMGVGAAFIKTA